MSALSADELSAILSIPGAMLAAPAEQRSKSTCQLKTPRKQLQVVPVLDASIGIAAIRDRYQKDCCHGNARAAKLLSKLVFRYQADDTGKPRLQTYRYDNFWWEKSYADWASELEITEDQVRTDFKNLKKWGLAEARPLRVFDGKNRGLTVVHARVMIACGAASLNGWPDYSQIGIVLEWENSHPYGTGEFPSHTNGTFPIHKAKEELKKEKRKGKDFAAQKPAATSLQPYQATGATGKGNPDPYTAPPAEPVKTQPNQFPEKYLETVPVADTPAKVQPLKGRDLLESIWRTYLETEHKMYCGKFTGEQRTKIQRFYDRVSEAGFDPADTLRKLLSPQNKVAWDKITSRIDYVHSPKAGVPAKPTLDFICTGIYTDVLITMMAERREADAKIAAYYAQHSAQVATVAPKPEPVAAPVEYDDEIDWNAKWASLGKKATPV